MSENWSRWRYRRNPRNKTLKVRVSAAELAEVDAKLAEKNKTARDLARSGNGWHQEQTRSELVRGLLAEFVGGKPEDDDE